MEHLFRTFGEINDHNDVINLLNDKFNLKEHIDNSNFFYWYDNIVIQYVTPHSGNNHKHMLMANHYETFNKWADCSIEVELKSLQQLCELIELLLTMNKIGAYDWEDED